ncbi:MAG: RNA-splicing ligase RtcB [Candidatus Latescibacteria bacterium]|nr:RNA-splicing ligase RtcB [Candidatus Latescibacterota bacterium]NIO27257.1 RNA-splicing ligase RtcB [Candidatus Latescibacterota bacterium]NIO54781.1 RNA-splicing ligase RtcB [Candidatus Latescibacterota bacterium]NIT00864.1 RNA-splicing ligase RtcB [Candidatus Latescibacterota bacterium]NIT37787.1 RNA-splicing ligase RtcB [Candidatus Latescibacterota bacterium]
MEMIKKSDTLWEIPAQGGMRVPGRILANNRMIELIQQDKSFNQVVNVAHLPGIVGYSWAMPDVHVGYGFPIGGVAATAFDEGGVVSPGGVGYDINCGVRMIACDLEVDEVRGKVGKLIRTLFGRVPCGPSAHESGWGHMNSDDLKKVLKDGARFVVEGGMGTDRDLTFSEENGAMPGADPDVVSTHAIDRGRRQLGSLGSGNHFLEVGYVHHVFSPELATVFGLDKGSVTILIHTGSRGFGHQVCTDYLKMMASKASSYDFQLPDRQLAAAPLDSSVGKGYLGAMAAAANFAWANRQTLMVLAQRAIAESFGTTVERLGFRLLYDVSHNIAKIELHEISGEQKKLCVHRKGATRALPPGDSRLPELYRPIGQPVLVPGDMGTASYLCVGSAITGEHPFFSTCHGAGRLMSRSAAIRHGKGRSIGDELKDRGVTVMAKDRRTLAEEMPEAYKDVAEVVDVMYNAGLLKKVVEVRPIGVIKG